MYEQDTAGLGRPHAMPRSTRRKQMIPETKPVPFEYEIT